MKDRETFCFQRYKKYRVCDVKSADNFYFPQKNIARVFSFIRTFICELFTVVALCTSRCESRYVDAARTRALRSLTGRFESHSHGHASRGWTLDIGRRAG